MKCLAYDVVSSFEKSSTEVKAKRVAFGVVSSFEKSSTEVKAKKVSYVVLFGFEKSSTLVGAKRKGGLLRVVPLREEQYRSEGKLAQ